MPASQLCLSYLLLLIVVDFHKIAKMPPIPRHQLLCPLSQTYSLPLPPSQRGMMKISVLRLPLSAGHPRQPRLQNQCYRAIRGLQNISQKTTPVTELVRLRLKDGVYPDIDDPKTDSGRKWKTLFQPLLRANGFQRYYWGRQFECPDVVSGFVSWDSVGHHMKFTETRYAIPCVIFL